MTSDCIPHQAFNMTNATNYSVIDIISVSAPPPPLSVPVEDAHAPAHCAGSLLTLRIALDGQVIAADGLLIACE